MCGHAADRALTVRRIQTDNYSVPFFAPYSDPCFRPLFPDHRFRGGAGAATGGKTRSHRPSKHTSGAQQSQSDMQRDVKWHVLSHARTPENVAQVAAPKSERSQSSDCESMTPSPHSSNASQKISSIGMTSMTWCATSEGRNLVPVASSKARRKLMLAVA